MENQKHKEPFSYTTEQANDIIVTESLLDEIAAFRKDEPDIKRAFSELTKMTKKEIGLRLTMKNLSDYWRNKLIPRRLRIKKIPPFHTEDTEFRSKWEAILNKCSLDLILLIIEHDKKEREAVQVKLCEIKSKISEIDDDKKKTLQDKLEKDMESHTKQLTQDKLQKYNRNVDDYKEGKVYKWSTPAQRQRYASSSTQQP